MLCLTNFRLMSKVQPLGHALTNSARRGRGAHTIPLEFSGAGNAKSVLSLYRVER